VNFRVIPSPLGVKVLISLEEAIKWGQAPFYFDNKIGLRYYKG
jgi:hypothetical protein